MRSRQRRCLASRVCGDRRTSDKSGWSPLYQVLGLVSSTGSVVAPLVSCAGDAPLGRFVGGFHVRVLAAVSWGWGLERVGCGAFGAFGDTVRVPFRVGLSYLCFHLLLWCQELAVDAIRQMVDLSIMRLYNRRRCLPLFCLRGSYCVLGGGDLRRTGIEGPVRHFNISIPRRW